MLIKYAFCMRVDEVPYERYMCLSEQVPFVVCLSWLCSDGFQNFNQPKWMSLNQHLLYTWQTYIP